MENGRAKKPNLLLEKIRADYFSEDLNRHTYLPVDSDEFGEIIPLLSELKVILIGLFAVENFAGKAGISLLYVLERRS